MKQIEYRCVTAFFPGPVQMNEYLNDAGADGWELINVSSTHHDDIATTFYDFIFKRVKE